MSKVIRLQQWLKELPHDAADLNDALQFTIKKSEEFKYRLHSDDFLILDGGGLKRSGDESMTASDLGAQVKPFFDLRFPGPGKGSCWQSLTVRRLPELTDIKSACKLFDQRGIVVGLQPELIDAFSLYVAQNKFKLLQKMYHVGQTYVSNTFAKIRVAQERLCLAPQGQTQVCFALVNPNFKSRSELASLSEMSEVEFMMEIELLRTLDAAFSHTKLASKYEVRVSSSELLDTLFEECNVNLESRVPLMQLLYEQSAPDDLSVSSEAAKARAEAVETRIKKIAAGGADIQKLQKLMKIRGSTDQVSKQLHRVQNIRCKPSFKSALAYFERLEERLKLFGVYAQAPQENQEKPIETKKE